MGAGSSFAVPPEVNNLPKNNKSLSFKVEYCSSWGGKPEANYAAQLIRTVYPNANVEVSSPGHTNNLVISVNGK